MLALPACCRDRGGLCGLRGCGGRGRRVWWSGPSWSSGPWWSSWSWWRGRRGRRRCGARRGEVDELGVRCGYGGARLRDPTTIGRAGAAARAEPPLDPPPVDPHVVSSCVTRWAPGRNTIRPSAILPVCFSPSEACQRSTASVVPACQASSIVIWPSANPICTRSLLSCRMSWPSLVLGLQSPVGRQRAVEQHHRAPVDAVERLPRLDHLPDARQPRDRPAEAVIDGLGIGVAERARLGVGLDQVAALHDRGAARAARVDRWPAARASGCRARSPPPPRPRAAPTVRAPASWASCRLGCRCRLRLPSVREAKWRRAARGQGLPVGRRLHVDRAGNRRIASVEIGDLADAQVGVGRDGGPRVGELGTPCWRMHTAILRSFPSVCAEGAWGPQAGGAAALAGTSAHFACAAFNAGDEIRQAWVEVEAPARPRVREVGHAIGAHAPGEREGPRGPRSRRSRLRRPYYRRLRRSTSGRSHRPRRRSGWESFPRIRPAPR